MKKVFYVSVGLLIIAGSLAYRHSPKHEPLSPETIQRLPAATPTPAAQKTAVKNTTPIFEKLTDLSSQIGQTVADPAKVEEELKIWAKSLSPTELKQLKDYALDLSQSQDTRFLSTYLLTQADSQMVSPYLEEIASTPLTGQDRLQNFEEILRAQAIENIRSVATLQNIAVKTDSSVVARRAQQQIWALQGRAENPTAQETKALEKLLRSNN